MLRLSRLHAALFLTIVGAVALMLLPSFSTSTAKAPVSPAESPEIEAEGYCMLSPVSLQQRTVESAIVVEGEVVSRHSFWDAKHQNIYTSNLVKVYKLFKGEVSFDQIEIISEGGRVGFERQVTTPALELTLGEMGVFFGAPSAIFDPTNESPAPNFRAYANVQGFIQYDLNDGTATEPFRHYDGIENEVYPAIISFTNSAPREIAANVRLANRHVSKNELSPNAVPTISTFTPTTITAGTDSVLTIVGTNFGATRGTGFVEFRNSDDGGASFEQPLASDYVSWSDTEIRVMVPSAGLTNSPAGTGTIRVTNSDPASVTSAGTLTVEYAYSNILDDGNGALPLASQMPDHINDNTTGGYTFTMDTGEFTPTAADDAFQRAMNTWTCATGVNWDTTTGAIDVIASDTINAVRFDDGAELDPGVLGVATSRYSGCRITPPPATYFTWRVTEIDVAFDDATNWEFGPTAPSAGEVDFESVAVHELGHAHQLGHVISPGTVMHFSIGAGVSQRVLSGADRAGGRFVQARSVVANFCGQGPMTNKTGTACSPTAAPGSVSGRITTADGQGLAGVSVMLSGGRSARTITDSSGHYRFATVDTENFYTVTPALVNYHFLPAEQSFSLVGNKTDAVFTAELDAAIVGNAIDSADFFVRQHYIDFLGREPDQSGFSFWSDQIRSCGNDSGCIESRRINVSAAYVLSIEFAATGGVVDGLYRASFGRRPAYAEFMPDVATIGQNVIVGESDWSSQLIANREAFIRSWVDRQAFKSVYDSLSNSDFVDSLISNTGIRFSQSERDELVGGLVSGGFSRAEVLTRIVNDQRFVDAKRNEMFVMIEYFGYLRRDPDEEGYRFWLNKLNQFDGNFERAEMVKAFIDSGEYRARFAR